MRVVCLMFWRKSDFSANKARKYLKKAHQQSIIHKLFWEFCLWIDIISFVERICQEAFQHMRGTIGMHVLTVGRVTGSPEQTMSQTISCWYISRGDKTSSLAIRDKMNVHWRTWVHPVILYWHILNDIHFKPTTINYGFLLFATILYKCCR